MNTEEKLLKLKKLADAMYYAAQHLTTDASRLHKAMDEYHKFIIHEWREEPVSEVWHDAQTEQPQAKEKILATNEYGDCEVDYAINMALYWPKVIKWAYIDDLLKLDNSCQSCENLQEEPVSEDIEAAAESYAKFERSDGGGGIDVTRLDAFIEGAQWQKKQKPVSEDILDVSRIDYRLQHKSIEDGIKYHAEEYSFNIESVLYNQLTGEQQKLWRKELERAVISGGYYGWELSRDKRYKENPVSEDLKIELEKYIKGHFTIDTEQLDRFGIEEKDYMYSMDKSDMLALVEHFTNWQKTKEEPVSEDIEEAASLYVADDALKPWQTMVKEAFKGGARWQKRQMMKDAVEATVTDIRTFKHENEVDFTIMLDKGIIPYETEEELKLIIIKED